MMSGYLGEVLVFLLVSTRGPAQIPTDADGLAAEKRQAGTQPQRLSDGGGLYLQIDPSGGRYWRYNYRFGGKQKTLALGVFPDVSLARARARHQTARQQLSDGVDPSITKHASTKTFEMVARTWHAHWKAGRNERHAQD